MRVNRLWRRRKWRRMKGKMPVVWDCPHCGMPIPKRRGCRQRRVSCYDARCMRAAKLDAERDRQAFIQDLCRRYPHRCTRCGVRPKWKDPGGVQHKWCRVCSKARIVQEERKKEQRRAEYEAHQAILRETELRIDERTVRRTRTHAPRQNPGGPPLEL